MRLRVRLILGNDGQNDADAQCAPCRSDGARAVGARQPACEGRTRVGAEAQGVAARCLSQRWPLQTIMRVCHQDLCAKSGSECMRGGSARVHPSAGAAPHQKSYVGAPAGFLRTYRPVRPAPPDRAPATVLGRTSRRSFVSSPRTRTLATPLSPTPLLSQYPRVRAEHPPRARAARRCLCGAMSFNFEWPTFSEAYYADAREILEQVSCDGGLGRSRTTRGTRAGDWRIGRTRRREAGVNGTLLAWQETISEANGGEQLTPICRSTGA